MAMNEQRVSQLAAELRGSARHDVAVALDFDGVCKLFTDHKHQIMFTCLFLHVREFQRVPFEVFRDAYLYINFRSPDYAGKERFLCAWALSEHLAAMGHACKLPGVAAAVAALRRRGDKINEENLRPLAGADDVARLIEWSREVNRRVGELTEIGLVPGLRENILDPFRDRVDFHVVSTATEGPLRASMQREGIHFIVRYVGQETAGKAEALVAMSRAGYRGTIMFGDSLEDSRASAEAAASAGPGGVVFFSAVIPGEEERCFQLGRSIVESVLSGNLAAARSVSESLAKQFAGREVGSQAVSPLSLRA